MRHSGALGRIVAPNRQPPATGCPGASRAAPGVDGAAYLPPKVSLSLYHERRDPPRTFAVREDAVCEDAVREDVVAFLSEVESASGEDMLPEVAVAVAERLFAAGCESREAWRRASEAVAAAQRLRDVAEERRKEGEVLQSALR